MNGFSASETVIARYYFCFMLCNFRMLFPKKLEFVLLVQMSCIHVNENTNMLLVQMSCIHVNENTNSESDRS
jgi:hypothetical protein